MHGSVVAERYASALFEVAKKKGIQEEIDGDLGLAKGLFENVKLRKFLSSPKVGVEKKMDLLRRALKGVVNPLVFNLFELLLDRERVAHLPEISSVFTSILEESKGIERAEVRTAIPMDEEIEKKLQRTLEEMIGKKVLLEKHVDSSLIGGVLVRMGDQLLDSTVRTRLRDMREELLAVKVH
jgi:F-type H+-transporting ATPase subunit delta